MFDPYSQHFEHLEKSFQKINRHPNLDITYLFKHPYYMDSTFRYLFQSICLRRGLRLRQLNQFHRIYYKKKNKIAHLFIYLKEPIFDKTATFRTHDK